MYCCNKCFNQLTMSAVAKALGTIIQQTWRTATAGHPLKIHNTYEQRPIMNLYYIRLHSAR